VDFESGKTNDLSYKLVLLYFSLKKKLRMEFGDIQATISKAIEQTKSDQIVPLINWLDGEISKFRNSGLCKYFNCDKTKILFDKIAEKYLV